MMMIGTETARKAQSATATTRIVTVQPCPGGGLRSGRASLLLRSRSMEWVVLARLCAHCDDKDRAIEWLAKALALGFDEFTLLKHDPALKALRDDPRFMRFLEGR